MNTNAQYAAGIDSGSASTDAVILIAAERSAVGPLCPPALGLQPAPARHWNRP